MMLSPANKYHMFLLYDFQSIADHNGLKLFLDEHSYFMHGQKPNVSQQILGIQRNFPWMFLLFFRPAQARNLKAKKKSQIFMGKFDAKHFSKVGVVINDQS